MNKTDLIKEVAIDTGFNREVVKKVINSMIAIVKKKLLFGVDVDIRDFVSFKRVISNATRKKDFTTGKMIDIPKRWRLKASAL